MLVQKIVKGIDKMHREVTMRMEREREREVRICM